MLRITAAAKALLLAVFALLSLTVATGHAVAAPSATGPASVIDPEAAPPVAAQGSCAPPDSEARTHPGQARRASRPETGAPQTLVQAARAVAAAPAELPRHAVVNGGDAPYCHAPSRSGDLPVALQVFRC